MPGVIRDRFQDLDANLKEPRVFANDVLQGRLNAAGITLGRIIFNTTFGLGGLFDVAATAGRICRSRPAISARPCSSGECPAGTYVVSPYFGPSTQRDSVGGVVDTVGDPVGWVLGGFIIGWPWSVGSGIVSAAAHLGQWKQAESSSVDFYTFLRSSFYQTRRAQLREAQGLPPQIESPATPGPTVGSPVIRPSRRIVGLRNPAASVDQPYEVELA